MEALEKTCYSQCGGRLIPSRRVGENVDGADLSILIDALADDDGIFRSWEQAGEVMDLLMTDQMDGNAGLLMFGNRRNVFYSYRGVLIQECRITWNATSRGWEKSEPTSEVTALKPGDRIFPRI